MKKKLLTTVLAASMAMSVLGGCGNSDSNQEVPSTQAADTDTKAENKDAVETTESEETAENTDTENLEDVQIEEAKVTSTGVTVRVGAMSGPTAMGMVKLMSDAEDGTTANTYEFAELATDASALVAPISKGELDIAALPSNLASNLYNKTQGAIEVIAVNNLGVLNIVERGDDVTSLADLAGKTVYATGQGAVPEYTLRYLLSENGVDADADVTIQWCSDTTEALSYVSADENAIAMLPQPFATAACAQVEGLHIAMDLNDEWDKLDTGCSIVTGVIVARKEFIEQNKEAVDAFLQEYEKSVSYTTEDAEGAAALIEKYGIVGKAALAQKALPGCHLQCMTGVDMKNALLGFLQILYDQNADSVGGSMPADDFYYGA